jgi:hypothetical protein
MELLTFNEEFLRDHQQRISKAKYFAMMLNNHNGTDPESPSESEYAVTLLKRLLLLSKSNCFFPVDQCSLQELKDKVSFHVEKHHFSFNLEACSDGQLIPWLEGTGTYRKYGLLEFESLDSLLGLLEGQIYDPCFIKNPTAHLPTSFWRRTLNGLTKTNSEAFIVLPFTNQLGMLYLLTDQDPFSVYLRCLKSSQLTSIFMGYSGAHKCDGPN